MNNKLLDEMRTLADSDNTNTDKPKKPKKLGKKQLDKEIERLYKIHGQNIQINIMDIGKIFNAGRQAYETGGDMEKAVQDAIAQLRKN